MFQYWEAVIENGTVVKKRVAKKLTRFGDRYRTVESVRPLADLILAPINARTSRPESSQTVKAFFEHVYLPHCKDTLKPSTYKSYGDFFKLLEPHFGGVSLREFRVSDGDRLLQQAASGKALAHTTHRNLKSFLSGGFRYARRKDLITSDPIRDAAIPRGKPKGETHAYSLDEILAMLKVLPEPARTVVLTAALTALRMGEVKGIRWEDLIGNELHVNRNVWRRHIQETKTLTSRAPVPLVPLVKQALEAHRERSKKKDGFVFQGATGQPLRLENLARRDIIPTLTKARLEWHGWHGFRRGVGTNLRALGVDMKTISEILRHANVSTTEAFYIKAVPEKASKAMRKLEKALSK